MHEFKINDYVKWAQDDGILIGKIASVNKKTVNILVEFDIYENIPFSEITYLPPKQLNHDDYQAVARYEKEISSALDGNVVANVINTDNYAITVEDYVSALQRISADKIDFDNFFDWCSFIERDLFACKQTDNADVYNEHDALLSLHDQVYNTWLGFDHDSIPAAIAEGLTFIEDKNKPYLERRYPLHVKERLLIKLESDAVMNTASEKQIALYRLFAEELANANNIYGLHAVGYGCYGGNRAFDCDWIRSKDCISKLFELTDKMPEKASLADTLGYIYYYGRCNDGVPDYDSAYKYFSFAAFNGIYEAQYKIADMFRNGYGVEKSRETAKHIITQLYYDNIKYIRDGEFNCKFADIALRMGGLFADNDDERDNNYEEALYYYMQARFAIRMRMMESNYYGDSKVSDSIAAAISATKEKLNFKPQRHIRIYYLAGLLGEETTDGQKLDLTIKKQGELTYKMTFTAHKKLGDTRGRKLFITVPELEMCGTFSKITLTHHAKEPLPKDILDKVLVVDEISYNGIFSDGARILFNDGYYVLKNNKKANEKLYRFVGVSFGGSKLYDYFCNDETIREGDHVLVNAQGEEKEVLVCRVFEKTESETSLPLKAYKTILRKA